MAYFNNEADARLYQLCFWARYSHLPHAAMHRPDKMFDSRSSLALYEVNDAVVTRQNLLQRSSARLFVNLAQSHRVKGDSIPNRLIESISGSPGRIIILFRVGIMAETSTILQHFGLVSCQLHGLNGLVEEPFRS